MHVENKKQFNKKRIEASKCKIEICRVEYLVPFQRAIYFREMKLDEKLQCQYRVRQKRES